MPRDSDSISHIMLSSKVSVGEYRKLEGSQDKQSIAQFVYARFNERYIVPFESMPRKSKHGFSIMAMSCLMMEAIVSFRLGYPDTKDKGKSENCFKYFFQQAEQFSEFRDVSAEFYKNVRCGILHQAETTGGWIIHRKGPLFDKATRTINATKFLESQKAYLHAYQQELEQADWDDEIWVNLRRKMDSIIRNCNRGRNDGK